MFLSSNVSLLLLSRRCVNRGSNKRCFIPAQRRRSWSGALSMRPYLHNPFERPSLHPSSERLRSSVILRCAAFRLFRRQALRPSVRRYPSRCSSLRGASIVLLWELRGASFLRCSPLHDVAPSFVRPFVLSLSDPTFLLSSVVRVVPRTPAAGRRSRRLCTIPKMMR